jgi:hypothetical protein
VTVVAAVVALLLQAAPPPAGRAPASIHGRVVNARTRSPIAGALVMLVEPNLATRTSAAGEFSFAGVPPGTRTITVSTVGYIFIRRSIAVTAGAAVEVSVPLAEGTGTYQESIDVAASTAGPPVPLVTGLSSSTLQDLRDVAADDPVRAVQALPGVATGDDFRAEFSVRGSAFRHVGLVIDDTATPLLFHTVRTMENAGSIAMINTDVLGGATLSVGAHAQEHGDWLGATLAFDLREGSRDRRAVRLAVSGTNASLVGEGPLGRRQRGSWLISIRKSYVDWLIRRVDPSVESTFGFIDGEAKVVYDLTRTQQLQVFAVSGRAAYEKSTASGPNELARATSTSAVTSVAWRHLGSRTLYSQRLAVAANRVRARGSLDQSQASGTTRSIMWRGDARLFASPRWRVEGGLRAEHQRLDQTLADYGRSGATVRLRNQQAIGAARTIAGAWTQAADQLRVAAVTSGVRGSSDTCAARRAAASPWLIAERTTPAGRVFGGIGGAHQFPALDDVRSSAEPPRTERAWSLDAGFDRPLRPSVHLRVTVFRRREHDVLRRVGEDQLVGGARVAALPFHPVAARLDGIAHGAEAVVERRAEAGPAGWIAYSWSHVSEHDRVTGETFDGDFDQRHTLNAFVQQRLSYRLKVSAKLRVGSNFPIVGYYAGAPGALVLGEARNRVRLPTYARLDISGSRTFTFSRSRLTAFFELLNVAGRRNLGPSDGSIRPDLTASGFTERLLPFVPSAGFAVEF